MDKTNFEQVGILLPNVHSHIVHYYPNDHHITCVIRIRVSADVAYNLVCEYPILVEPRGKRLWLQVIYDVPYQEYMPKVMHQKFNFYLSKLQLMVANVKIVRQKQRIDHLRNVMTMNTIQS